MSDRTHDGQRTHGSAAEVLFAFLRLGCTCFGGPVAHLGYFRAEFVERRRWLSEAAYAEMIALAQSLPGPASSQTGYMIGLQRAGLMGGLAAWLGFTLPSACLMWAFAFGHTLFTANRGQAVLHGLQLVAVAVVAQAVLAMQRNLAPDLPRLVLAGLAAAIVLLAPPAVGTPLAIAMGALAGLLLMHGGEPTAESHFHAGVSQRAGTVAAELLLVILVASAAAGSNSMNPFTVFALFTRAGALVFGGGHVVLPLLESSIVARGWIGQPAFLAGYGAAQAMPGPLFTFASYLGAAITPNPHPTLYSVIALVSIFAPGLLIVTAILPYWNAVRGRPALRNALRGVNAAVVGVLFAALLRPVASSALRSPWDVCIALAALLLLTVAKLPPWSVVFLTVALAYLVALAR